jgi:putative tryptophan/tyrosine transport system substrate-binding protein
MRCTAAALAIWFCIAVPALAQDRPELPVIGILRTGTPATVGPFVGMFRDALAALGDVDGKNVRLDVRLAEGDVGRFPELAAALVRDNPSVIVAGGEAAARAAQAATRTIPIVASTNDLVASGLIASLAKPGGNLTGVSLLITELDAKRLDVLKEIVPSGRRFGVLNDPAISGPPGLHALADTARTLGVELLRMDAPNPAEIAPALASLRAAGVHGVDVLSSPLFNGFREQLGSLLREHMLPAICEWREMAAAGCLASYGTTLRELYGMLAALTDKMLKGASPADTPALQPTRSELVINLKVAEALGVQFPSAIFARADEVIE